MKSYANIRLPILFLTLLLTASGCSTGYPLKLESNPAYAQVCWHAANNAWTCQETPYTVYFPDIEQPISTCFQTTPFHFIWSSGAKVTTPVKVCPGNTYFVANRPAAPNLSHDLEFASLRATSYSQTFGNTGQQRSVSAPPGAPAICNCKGYDGPGGPCYSGPGGPAYAGPGGPAYDGPGGACYAGPGGAMYSGPGGPAYDGPGGPAYDGPGGPAYDGPGGPCYSGPGGPAYDGPGGPCYAGPGGTGANCPAICRN
jgi:hypothetical protein